LKKKYSKKSDVYSYGVLLYEILARDVPWKGIDFAGVIVALNKGSTMDVPKGPLVLQQIMQLCWKADANERPTFSSIIDIITKNNFN